MEIIKELLAWIKYHILEIIYNVATQVSLLMFTTFLIFKMTGYNLMDMEWYITLPFIFGSFIIMEVWRIFSQGLANYYKTLNEEEEPDFYCVHYIKPNGLSDHMFLYGNYYEVEDLFWDAVELSPYDPKEVEIVAYYVKVE